MGEKISTIAFKVDLNCQRCSRKIKKTICKLQGMGPTGDYWNIKTIVYNDKNNTVTISGAFNPHNLSKEVCSMASKVIKEIHIKEEKPPQMCVIM